jgi:polyferredoxin
LIVLVVLAGHRFRRAWKDRESDPRWHRRAWVYGVFAFFGLLVLAFVPMQA